MHQTSGWAIPPLDSETVLNGDFCQLHLGISYLSYASLSVEMTTVLQVVTRPLELVILCFVCLSGSSHKGKLRAARMAVEKLGEATTR